MAKKLSKKILAKLLEQANAKEPAIRNELSAIRRAHPLITLNAAAQVFASKRGFNVMRMLDEEDRARMPNAAQIPAVRIAAMTPRTTKQSGKQKPVVPILNYVTSDPFGKKHVDEANRAYHAGCYTAAVILCRKIFENLIIDLLTKQFPQNNAKNKELYYDTGRGRFNDFSVIEQNLYDKRQAFPATSIKVIERLHAKMKPFLKGANDHAHSWYYTCTKAEFDAMNVQEVADLIANIAKTVEEAKAPASATPSK